MSLEHWWNSSERGNRSTGIKTSPTKLFLIYILSTVIYTRLSLRKNLVSLCICLKLNGKNLEIISVDILSL
jgi:hypothetical protein